MDSFFQRIGALLVVAWAAGIIGFLYYILKYLIGIAQFLVYLAG
tara:strand:+ start:7563 stop:7694 length:132 start_codon:yes stop_codon:yes gene_type:complete